MTRTLRTVNTGKCLCTYSFTLSPEIYLNFELTSSTPHFNNFRKITQAFRTKFPEHFLEPPPNHQFQREKRKTDSTILSSAEFKKAWSCTSSNAQVVKA